MSDNACGATGRYRAMKLPPLRRPLYIKPAGCLARHVTAASPRGRGPSLTTAGRAFRADQTPIILYNVKCLSISLGVLESNMYDFDSDTRWTMDRSRGYFVVKCGHVSM